MKAKSKKKGFRGFSYYCDSLQIKEYMKLPVEFKLTWLEEANKFCHFYIPPQNKEIWEKFRKGEI